MNLKAGTQVTGHITNSDAGRVEFAGTVTNTYDSNGQTIVTVDCEDGIERSARAENLTPRASAEPEWRTLKGVSAPFLVHVHESNGHLWTARDRKAPDGKPVKVARLELSGGLRCGYTEEGQKINFSGVATKMWVTQ